MNRPKRFPYESIDRGVQKLCKKINRFNLNVWTDDSCDGHGKKEPYIRLICLDMKTLIAVRIKFKKDIKRMEVVIALGVNAQHKFVYDSLPRFVIYIK